MTAIISLNCIEQTISNLNYRSKISLKYRLLQEVRRYYTDESCVATLTAISPESLIESLWETGGAPHLISKKRKNLNSVRSSVNGDLQKLFEAGNNPDGITISPENIFVMSDEAKDKALKSFLDKIPGDTPANLDEISKILNAVNDVLSNPEGDPTEDPSDRLQKLAEMKTLIQSLSDKIGLQETGTDGETGGSSSFDTSTDGSAGAGQSPEGDTTGHGQEDGLSGMADDGGDTDVASLPVDEDDVPESLELDDELEELEFLDELVDEGAPGEDESGQSGDGPDDRSGDGGGVETDLNDSAGAGQSSEGDTTGHGQKDGLSGMADDGGDTDVASLPVDEDDVPESLELDDELEELEFLDELEAEDALGEEGPGGPAGGPHDQTGDAGGVETDLNDSAGAGQSREGDTTGHGQKDGLSGMADDGGDTDVASLPVDEVDDPETIEIEDDLEELEFLDELVDEGAPDEDESGQSGDGPDDRSGDAGNADSGLDGSAGEGQSPEGDTIDHGQEDSISGMGDDGGNAEGASLSVDDEDDPEVPEIEDDLEEVDLLEEIDLEDDPGEDGPAGSGDNEQGTDRLPQPVDEEDVPEITETEDDLEEVDLLEEIDLEDDQDENGVDGSGSGHQDDGENTGNTADTNEAPDTPAAMAVDNDLDAFEIGDDTELRDNPPKARYLAETFNRSLAAMDKFFNQYIQIPEGKYIVGASQPRKKEKSKQMITLASFYIGKFPVTNALFEVFVEKTGYITTAEQRGFGTVYEGRYQKTVDPHHGREKHSWRSDIVSNTVKGAFWYQPAGPGSNIHKKRNHPVVQVSIHDALAFAAWTGKRLPTEEEWEAASRTANGFDFPWGNDWQAGACNIEESYLGDTTPVDSYLDFENGFGLADTLGNVLEWTFCPAPPQSESNQPASFIAKGGSWISGNDLRLYSNSQMEAESHSNLLGFRSVAY